MGGVAIGLSPQPNDVDRKRIERSLNQRRRYRYVSPEVRAVENGYQIKSPCCSRNIDKSGGMIDIARLEYRQDLDAWRLYSRAHRQEEWHLQGEFATLRELLQQLNLDPERIFWP